MKKEVIDKLEKLKESLEDCDEATLDDVLARLTRIETKVHKIGQHLEVDIEGGKNV